MPPALPPPFVRSATSATSSDPGRRAVFLYLTFAATGVGLALPGILMPALLPLWFLSDNRAGLLLFLFALGSIAGALLARGRLTHSTALGCLTTACGALALSVATRSTALPAITLFGVGLGLIMTAISLLQARSNDTVDAAGLSGRVVRLTRLNLAWAIGACAAPVLILRSAASHGPQRTLQAVAAAFVLLSILTVLTLAIPVHAPSTAPALPQTPPAADLPFALLLMVPLATGIESAVAGWLATFTIRSAHALNITILETTAFWAGILLSRSALSNRTIAARLGPFLLLLCPAVMFAALSLLLFSAAHLPALLAALLLGVGAGPLYPALLARILRSAEAGNLVFVAAGVGACTLPLLTGLISGHTGSLRLGLEVPLAAALVLTVCGFWLRRRNA